MPIVLELQGGAAMKLIGGIAAMLRKRLHVIKMKKVLNEKTIVI
ncbi:hypothetical protein [Paenibacillus oenotherae]|nr:hypothetical protein [Paenibacillus oenotherae]